mmetsp:Transcript_20240/g.65056  ORF Transcript_20240/g.65056 Transcript_20240/m.65056 type:complete len:408 (-) Transcript_20240:312-1535(-)
MSVKRVDAFWGEELGGKGALATSLEAAVGYELLRCVAMLCAAHTVGVLHHFHHARGMWRHLVLEARQRALMRCIEEETATCDRLLKSILPPHLVRSLGSLDLEQGPGSHGVGSGPSASHHGSSTGTASTSADWYAATGRAEASCSSGGGGGGDLPDRAERVERISRGEFGTVQPSARRAGFDRPARPQRAQLAESFSECAFLFAKVDGLSALLNDATAEPPRVIKLLQSMFDRFDRLADVFQLQKVRKTANEQYLVAAGLPDPTRLPDPHDRAAAAAGFGFAIINVMSVVNLELRAEAPRAPQLTVQVGIDFGSAIAGVIGHKTYQYDLCGDAVNTAARMCTGSEPGRVHVSQEAYRYLRGRFGATSRGPRYYKGKGEMYTYFLENAPGALPEEATPAPADAAEAIY